MCGRYLITSPVTALSALFGFENQLPNLAPDYNVAPTTAVPFVRRGEAAGEGARVLDFARWGFVPSWAKEIGVKPLINARGETAAEKPSFRAAYKRRRCLVPADGFYEWQSQPAPEGGGKAPPKQPYLFQKPGGGPFAFAGLYEHWLGKDGTELTSLALLTYEANPFMAAFHHRVPVIVQPEDYPVWLTAELDPPAPGAAEAIAALVKAPPEAFFEAVPVSRAVNKVGNNGPELIAPLRPAEPPGETGDLFG